MMTDEKAARRVDETSACATLVAADLPGLWTVLIDDHPHLVAIGDPSWLSGRREVRVDDRVVTKLGVTLFHREADFRIDVGSREGHLRRGLYSASFRRNFRRDLAAGPYGNSNITWETYRLEVDGATDGWWVATVIGSSHHHWSFGRATAGLPCCGTDTSDHDVWCPTQLPDARHDDPVLEWLLPATVGGRPLRRWSLLGWDVFEGSGPLSGDQRREIEAELAADDIRVDDLRQACAGRSNPADPPDGVTAIRVPGAQASALPAWFGLSYPGRSGGLPLAVLGGKTLRRGVPEMLIEDENIRGTPFLYDHDQVRFIIISDQEGWVAEVAAQLP